MINVCHAVFQTGCNIFNPHQQSVKDARSPSLLQLHYVNFLHFCYVFVCMCMWKSYCSFNFYFYDDQWWWEFLLVLYNSHIFSFVRCLLKYFGNIYIRLYVFLIIEVLIDFGYKIFDEHLFYKIISLVYDLSYTCIIL